MQRLWMALAAFFVSLVLAHPVLAGEPEGSGQRVDAQSFLKTQSAAPGEKVDGTKVGLPLSKAERADEKAAEAEEKAAEAREKVAGSLSRNSLNVGAAQNRFMQTDSKDKEKSKSSKESGHEKGGKK